MDKQRTEAVYRLEDNELMGVISLDPTSDNAWIPLTIFHYPLAAGMPKNEAVNYLRSYGLEVLSDTWQFYDESDGEWYVCNIVEAKPDHLTIKISDYGHNDVFKVLMIQKPNERKIRYK